LEIREQQPILSDIVHPRHVSQKCGAKARSTGPRKRWTSTGYACRKFACEDDDAFATRVQLAGMLVHLDAASVCSRCVDDRAGAL
jgi:hypothetical protein